MDFCLATCSALFLLFAAASCAPTGQDACAAVSSSSMRLQLEARNASITAQNGSILPRYSSSMPWIESEDMCDPEALRQDSVPCIGKILDVLAVYNSSVKRLAGFQSCSRFVGKVKSAMHQLLEDLSKCVSSKAGMNRQKHIFNEDNDPIPTGEELLLCQYTLHRLYSFSTLTARVFAEGDPARLTEASTQKCM